MALYCDMCDRLVDRECDGGTFDEEAGVYSCERCLDDWQWTVTGAKPITREIVSFSAETLRFAEQCAKEYEQEMKS